MSKRPLKEIVERIANKDGVIETGIDGVQLYRVTNSIERLPGVYTPRLCLNVSGSKRVFVNGEVHVYDDSHFICCTMPVPVDADIPTASEENPLLGISVEFDERLMAETAVAMSSADFEFRMETVAEDNGLMVGNPSDKLEDALTRLLKLAEDPVALEVLGDSRLREVYYAILRSDAGPQIRQRFSEGDEIANTIRYLKENLRQAFSIDELARRAGMSRAVFHRKFKQTTGLSPVQFIKSLRLNTAAMHMVSGMRVSEAAHEVGYASSSQFSREFKRQFGKSPRDWELEFGTQLPGK